MVPPWSMCGSRFIVGGKNNPKKSEDHKPYTYSVLNDKVFFNSLLLEFYCCNTYRVFKKNALIENRFKDTKFEAKLHWKSSFSFKWPSLSQEKYVSIFTWVFIGRFMGVFGLFHGCFKDTSRSFPKGFNVILEYVMKVSREFQRCSKGVSFQLSLLA